MKTMILAAVAALGLAAAAPAANAAVFGGQTTSHQGSYDNTNGGPQQTGLEGGGG